MRLSLSPPQCQVTDSSQKRLWSTIDKGLALHATAAVTQRPPKQSTK